MQPGQPAHGVTGDWRTPPARGADSRSPMSRAANDSTPRWVRGTWLSGGTDVGPASTASMICAIVRTDLIGYRPTLVSPDSITASAPSSTALATSEASARVGREW